MCRCIYDFTSDTSAMCGLAANGVCSRYVYICCDRDTQCRIQHRVQASAHNTIVERLRVSSAANSKLCAPSWLCKPAVLVLRPADHCTLSNLQNALVCAAEELQSDSVMVVLLMSSAAIVSLVSSMRGSCAMSMLYECVHFTVFDVTFSAGFNDR